jgi:2-polyprenyl-6-hydroxyphenyl methylase/3-demethylubiquinone-9 3-methyltransferase
MNRDSEYRSDQSYYDSRLNALRLKQVYDLATPRVRQYLDAEIGYVAAKVEPGDVVLDLGCGYGRTLPVLAAKAARVVGIDSSVGSLLLGKTTLGNTTHCCFAAMNAVHLGFQDAMFDSVVCIQNGISAFHVDQKSLIREAVRVAKPNGRVLFSSYARKFWDHRLEWFRLQAHVGLLGEIDETKTKDGVIVCKDGFTATTVEQDDFLRMTAELELNATVNEVDESSVFCEITPGT